MEDVKELIFGFIFWAMFAIVFVGIPLLIGLYLQFWLIMVITVLSAGFMIMAIENALDSPFYDPDAGFPVFKTWLLIVAVLWTTYYIATDQIFIRDFWIEYKHWVIR